MAIEWLAGNRLRGTTAERPNFGLPSGSVGGWVELARTTLGSANRYIDVTSLPNKRYYMILHDSHGHANTAGTIRVRYNTDNGTNYAHRRNANGGADGTSVNEISDFIGSFAEDTNPLFAVGYLSNLSSKEKLTIWHNVEQRTAGAGNAPHRNELVGKWTNTTDPLDEVQIFTGATNSYNTNSEVVVLGWDPADTHTTNFWEELADVELSSASDTLSSGTITAKKYLWVQLFIKNSGVAQPRLQFNSDTGSNYHSRISTNGASDTTNQPTAGDGGVVVSSDTTSGHTQFANVFIINNTSNEKLVIAHAVGNNSSGAGNAPYRRETVSKWANTSNQITQIDAWNNKTGDFDSGSIIKVWGAD